MSPRVGRSIVVDSWTHRGEAPADKLRVALDRVVEQGIHLTWSDECGAVHCPHTSGWCLMSDM